MALQGCKNVTGLGPAFCLAYGQVEFQDLGERELFSRFGSSSSLHAHGFLLRCLALRL